MARSSQRRPQAATSGGGSGSGSSGSSRNSNVNVGRHDDIDGRSDDDKHGKLLHQRKQNWMYGLRPLDVILVGVVIVGSLLVLHDHRPSSSSYRYSSHASSSSSSSVQRSKTPAATPKSDPLYPFYRQVSTGPNKNTKDDIDNSNASNGNDKNNNNNDNMMMATMQLEPVVFPTVPALENRLSSTVSSEGPINVEDTTMGTVVSR